MMLPLVLSVLLTGAEPTFPPLPWETKMPAAAPSPGPLPEIGRTRSRIACTVMRDVTVPAFAAARRGDQRFDDVAVRLRDYVKLRDDKEHSQDVFREAALSRIDQQATNLLGDVKSIGDILGDPRIAANQQDPQVRAQRAQLEQLYATQAARAKLLWMFVEQERREVVKIGLGQSDAFSSRNLPPEVINAPTPMPRPSQPPLGMPDLSGVDLGDVQTIDRWTGGIKTDVRASENQAAKTFYTIARSCR